MSVVEAWPYHSPTAFARAPTTPMQGPVMPPVLQRRSSEGLSSAPPRAASPGIAMSVAPSTHGGSGAGDCITANVGSTRAKSRKSRKMTGSAPASSPSLSSSSLGKTDDWTRVKDPKEKKRIQNRVAQRTYRNRMKAKLDELQAKLDCHEQQRGYRNGLDDRESCARAESAANGSSYAPAEAAAAAARRSAVGTKSSFQQPACMLQPCMYEGISDHHPAHAFYGNGISSSYVGGSQPAASGYFASSTSPHLPLGAAADRPIIVSQDFVLNCLRFQTQLLNRLNSLQDPGIKASAAETSTCAAADHIMAPTLSSTADACSSPPLSDMGTFTPGHLDLATFDNMADGWDSDALDPDLRHPPPPPPLSQPSQQHQHHHQQQQQQQPPHEHPEALMQRRVEASGYGAMVNDAVAACCGNGGGGGGGGGGGDALVPSASGSMQKNGVARQQRPKAKQDS